METKVLLSRAKKDYSDALNLGALITMGYLSVNISELLESFLILTSWVSKFKQEEDKEVYSEMIDLFQFYLSRYEECFFDKEYEIANYLKVVKALSESERFSEEERKSAKDFVAQLPYFSRFPKSWECFLRG